MLVFSTTLFGQYVGQGYTPSSSSSNSTRLVSDSILVYTEDGVEVGRDTTRIKEKPINKLVVNLRDYNPVADGSTDDVAAFRNAIAATPNSGKLYIPAGTYFLSDTLLIDKSISIVGDGVIIPASSTQSGAGGNDETRNIITFKASGAGTLDFAEVSGITIDATTTVVGDGTNGIGRIRFVKVDRVRVNNVTQINTHNGIDLFDCTVVNIDGLTEIENEEAGISFFGNTDQAIITNYHCNGCQEMVDFNGPTNKAVVDAFTGKGITPASNEAFDMELVDEVLISNGIVSGFANGFNFKPGASGSRNSKISNVTVLEFTGYGAQISTFGSTAITNQVGNITFEGVRFISSLPSTVGIKAIATNNACEFCDIENVSIQNSEVRASIGIDIDNNVKNVVISGSTVVGETKAIDIQGVGFPVRNVHIVDNPSLTITQAGTSNAVVNCVDVKEGLVITGNTIPTSPSRGVLVVNCDNPQVTHNHVVDVFDTGVQLRWDSDADISATDEVYFALNDNYIDACNGQSFRDAVNILFNTAVTGDFKGGSISQNKISNGGASGAKGFRIDLRGGTLDYLQFTGNIVSGFTGANDIILSSSLGENVDYDGTVSVDGSFQIATGPFFFSVSPSTDFALNSSATPASPINLEFNTVAKLDAGWSLSSANAVATYTGNPTYVDLRLNAKVFVDDAGDTQRANYVARIVRVNDGKVLAEAASTYIRDINDHEEATWNIAYIDHSPPTNPSYQVVYYRETAELKFFTVESESASFTGIAY